MKIYFFSKIKLFPTFFQIPAKTMRTKTCHGCSTSNWTNYPICRPKWTEVVLVTNWTRLSKRQLPVIFRLRVRTIEFAQPLRRLVNRIHRPNSMGNISITPTACTIKTPRKCRFKKPCVGNWYIIVFHL